MAIARENIHYFSVGGGSVDAAVVAGDQTIIRDARATWLHNVETYRQLPGFTRIVSPLLHDAQVGITRGAPAGVGAPLYGPIESLVAQDVLRVIHEGGGVAGSIAYTVLGLHHSDLAGIQGNYVTKDHLAKHYGCPYSWRVAVPVIPGPSFGPTVPLTVTEDQMIANRQYAIVGFTVAGALPPGVVRLGITGSDFGFLRFSAPLGLDYDQSAHYWQSQDEVQPFAAIPVISSNQRFNTFLSVLADETGAGTLTVVLHSVLMKDSQRSRCK